MSHVLDDRKQQQILSFGQLGWTPTAPGEEGQVDYGERLLQISSTHEIALALLVNSKVLINPPHSNGKS